MTLLAMPPAWVDFSWELVRDERDNAKCVSFVVLKQDWIVSQVQEVGLADPFQEKSVDSSPEAQQT